MIEDLFDKLQGVSYLSRIKLKSNFHQIQIVSNDIHKTTSFGLFEYLDMPFELTNAPAKFNRMMDNLFRSYRTYIGVFFHNVIVYSKSIEEHKKHLWGVFQVLRDNKLYVNL